MNAYRILLTEHAIDDLRKLPGDERNRIHSHIHSLGSSPFPSGKRIKRLKGFNPPLFRLRAGNYRIIYQIEEETVTVLRVLDRKLLARIVKNLAP